MPQPSVLPLRHGSETAALAATRMICLLLAAAIMAMAAPLLGAPVILLP